MRLGCAFSKHSFGHSVASQVLTGEISRRFDPYFLAFCWHIIGAGCVGHLYFLIIHSTCTYIYIASHLLPLTWLSSSSFSIQSPGQCIGRCSHLGSLWRNIVAIHEELRKDREVENERASTSNQPAQVDQNVFAVNIGSLTGLAVATLVPVAV